MQCDEADVITTEVEIINYHEETGGFYKDIKVEAASPDSDAEPQYHDSIAFCKVESFDGEETVVASKTGLSNFYMVENEESDKTICRLCNESFSKYSDLLKHDSTCAGLKQEENKPAKGPNKKKLHKCEICGKAFKLIGHLKRHVVCHTGEKQYVCEVCERPFADTSTLRKHCRTHTGQKNFKCEICEKTFSQRSHMKTHLLIHTGEKRFECRFCGKTFRHGNNYRTHVRTHTGERPYYCAACDKAFNDGSCFRRHLKRKTHKRRA